ncbi:MAG: hypothetical protein KDE31_17050, partial [Caldilineaceae bacterium]|nr:hypothetical protein [Caldilineaceae bacterium]
DIGTTVAQTLSRFKKKLAQAYPYEPELSQLFTDAIDTFARDDLAAGSHQLGQLLQSMPLDSCEYVATTVAEACAEQLRNQEEFRDDYLLLAIHTLLRCLSPN